MSKAIPNILIVDDSSTNNLLLESALGSFAFNISSAESGKVALSILNKKDIDIVLLDIMMPGMSGYDVLEEMYKVEKLALIPVIMVSAKNRGDDGKRAEQLGAVDYFEKPLDLDKLVARVQELVDELV